MSLLECLAPVASASSTKGAQRSDDPRFREKLAKFLKQDASDTWTITPLMAKIMLELNTGNRTLSITRANKYAKDMREGNWKLTGEPIIFSAEGILNDGQTRLHACVLAGSPFESDVRFGIERAAFTVTGCGAKRTLADVFSIQGEHNPTRLAGALNYLNQYLNGLGTPTLSHMDGQAFLAAHPDIRKSVEPGSSLYSVTRLIPPSLSIFLHYVFALKDADKADAFFEFLREGVGASGKRDPRLVIRERLIANKSDKAKIDEVEIAALTIKAFNVYMKGKEVASLKWQTNPAKGTPEPFPKVL